MNQRLDCEKRTFTSRVPADRIVEERPETRGRQFRLAIEGAMLPPTPPNFEARVPPEHKQANDNDHNYVCRDQKCIQHEISMG